MFGLRRYKPRPFFPANGFQKYNNLEFLGFNNNQIVTHQLRIGATGTGKSNLGMQDILRHRLLRKPAVIFDPHGSYIKYLYEPGDIMLRPDDTRCCYWDLQAEHDQDVITCTNIARNMTPRGRGGNDKNELFHLWTLKALAALLEIKNPSTRELAEYLANMEAFREALQGHSAAATLPEHGNDQRAGVEGLLSNLSDPLAMLPKDPEGRERFAVREFIKKPRGRFVWMTATTDNIKTFQSYYAGIMSWFLECAMTPEASSEILFFYDETHEVGYVERLPNAYTGMRKFGNILIAGFQHPAQAEDIYGKATWKTMWSQVGTRFVSAVDAEYAAETSKLFGKQLVRRAKYSQTVGGENKGAKTVTLEDKEADVVTADQIQGTANLDFWLLQRGLKPGEGGGRMLAVPVTIPVIQLPVRAPEHIPRKLDPVVFSQPPKVAPGEIGPPLVEQFAQHKAAAGGKTKKATAPKNAKTPKKEFVESTKLNATQIHNLGVFATLDGRAGADSTQNGTGRKGKKKQENPFAD